MLREAVLASTSFAGVLRHLGLRQAGGTQAHVANRIRYFGIETTHFTGQAHGGGRPSGRRRAPSEILVRHPEGSFREKPPVLRRALIELGRAHLCAHCDLNPDEIRLTLHVDHINGD